MRQLEEGASCLFGNDVGGWRGEDGRCFSLFIARGVGFMPSSQQLCGGLAYPARGAVAVGLCVAVSTPHSTTPDHPALSPVRFCKGELSARHGRTWVPFALCDL